MLILSFYLSLSRAPSAKSLVVSRCTQTGGAVAFFFFTSLSLSLSIDIYLRWLSQVEAQTTNQAPFWTLLTWSHMAIACQGTTENQRLHCDDPLFKLPRWWPLPTVELQQGANTHIRKRSLYVCIYVYTCTVYRNNVCKYVIYVHHSVHTRA